LALWAGERKDPWVKSLTKWRLAVTANIDKINAATFQRAVCTHARGLTSQDIFLVWNPLLCSEIHLRSKTGTAGTDMLCVPDGTTWRWAVRLLRALKQAEKARVQEAEDKHLWRMFMDVGLDSLRDFAKVHGYGAADGEIVEGYVGFKFADSPIIKAAQQAHGLKTDVNEWERPEHMFYAAYMRATGVSPATRATVGCSMHSCPSPHDVAGLATVSLPNADAAKTIQDQQASGDFSWFHEDDTESHPEMGPMDLYNSWVNVLLAEIEKLRGLLPKLAAQVPADVFTPLFQVSASSPPASGQQSPSPRPASMLPTCCLTDLKPRG
jgi:hypothetical protein